MSERFDRARVVVMNASLNVGGAERLLAETARRMDRTRFEVQVFCLYEAGAIGEELRGDGVAVADGFLNHRMDVLGFLRLAKAMRQFRPDVLYYNNQPLTQLWGWLAAVTARVPALVSLFQFTNRRPEGARRGRLLNRLLAGRVQACIATSESHRRFISEKEGVPARKIVIVPNGIDTRGYASTSEGRERVRRELGIPNDAVVVTIVAQLRPEKNHEMFIRAAREVLQGSPEAVFLSAGGGAELSHLEALTRELGVDGSVRFLGARSDVPDVMAASDVGVLCSFGRIETFPLALLEFMASGKPVVSTNVGSVAQIVVDGETGFVIDEGDTAALARSLRTLVEDPEARARMGKAALDRARSRFDVQTMVSAIENVIAEALARSRGATRGAAGRR